MAGRVPSKMYITPPIPLSFISAVSSHRHPLLLARNRTLVRVVPVLITIHHQPVFRVYPQYFKWRSSKSRLQLLNWRALVGAETRRTLCALCQVVEALLRDDSI